MAKVPLVPAWMKEEFEDWARPDGPEPVAPTEEDNILIAEALAMEWNGQLIPIEVVERRVRNALRREKRKRLKEEAQAQLEAAAKAGIEAAAPGTAESAGQSKPAAKTRASARPKSAAARPARVKRGRIEGRGQLGLPSPDKEGTPARGRRSGPPTYLPPPGGGMT